MNVSKMKALVVVLALLLVSGVITVGCKQKPQVAGWVNTDSLPGQGQQLRKKSSVTHQKSSKNHSKKKSNQYSSGVSFGPSDVSFDFKNLK